MSYRAEPEGVLAVVEVPRRELPAADAPSSSSRSGSRSRATSARWRAPRTRPAPTRCSSPTRVTDPWNPNAIRASTGAVFTLPIVEATLADVRALPLQKIAAVVGAPTPYTEPTSRNPTALLVGAEDDGLDAAWRDVADLQVDDPDARATVDSLNATTAAAILLYRGAFANVVELTAHPRRRRTRARDDRRPPPAHAAPLEPHARRAAQVRALPAHRLVQVARRAEQASAASARRRSERGVIAISAGNHAQAVAYAAAEENVDALVVMWQGASEQKIAATRGYGATVDLEATRPGRGVRAARHADRGDRPHARPSVRRPDRDRRRRHRRARDRGGRPRRRRGRRPGRRRRARSPGSRPRSATASA